MIARHSAHVGSAEQAKARINHYQRVQRTNAVMEHLYPPSHIQAGKPVADVRQMEEFVHNMPNTKAGVRAEVERLKGVKAAFGNRPYATIGPKLIDVYQRVYDWYGPSVKRSFGERIEAVNPIAIRKRYDGGDAFIRQSQPEPPAEIRSLVASLRREVKEDPHMSDAMRKNVLKHLEVIGKRGFMRGVVLQNMAESAVDIQNEKRALEESGQLDEMGRFGSKEEVAKFANGYSNALESGELPEEGEFGPAHTAAVYRHIHKALGRPPVPETWRPVKVVPLSGAERVALAKGMAEKAEADRQYHATLNETISRYGKTINRNEFDAMPKTREDFDYHANSLPDVNSAFEWLAYGRYGGELRAVYDEAATLARRSAKKYIPHGNLVSKANAIREKIAADPNMSPAAREKMLTTLDRITAKGGNPKRVLAAVESHSREVIAGRAALSRMPKEAKKSLEDSEPAAASLDVHARIMPEIAKSGKLPRSGRLDPPHLALIHDIISSEMERKGVK